MWRQFGPAFRITLAFTVLTGFIYPFLVTGVCQALFHRQANGSLIKVHGEVVGSSLIGQSFSEPKYFHPRPSAAGSGYDASSSGASNDGPTSQELIGRVKASIAKFRKNNPEFAGPIPADLFTASASGLDPDISIASAEAQAQRIAQARGISLNRVLGLLHKEAKGRELGFLGEPRVNVLALNLELDHEFPPTP